jgi:hypothetical protein
VTTLRAALGEMVRHPVRHLWRRWNYKSAITSAAARGLLFFATNLSAGSAAATSALATEFWFRFATAGFYGALTQSLRHVEPARTGLIAAMVILPLVAHTIEYAIHSWRGTANLGLSIAVSVCFTTVSTAFNWFAMRHGLLIVGERGSRSLWADLRAVPRLIARCL